MPITNKTAKHLCFLCFGLCLIVLSACAKKTISIPASINISDQSPTALDEIVFDSLNFSQLSCVVVYEETTSIAIAPAILSTTTFQQGDYKNVTVYLSRETTTNEQLTITAYENRCEIKSDYVFGETQLKNTNVIAIKKINVNLMAEYSGLREVYPS